MDTHDLGKAFFDKDVIKAFDSKRALFHTVKNVYVRDCESHNIPLPETIGLHSGVFEGTRYYGVGLKGDLGGVEIPLSKLKQALSEFNELWNTDDDEIVFELNPFIAHRMDMESFAHEKDSVLQTISRYEATESPKESYFHELVWRLKHIEARTNGYLFGIERSLSSRFWGESVRNGYGQDYAHEYRSLLKHIEAKTLENCKSKKVLPKRYNGFIEEC